MADFKSASCTSLVLLCSAVLLLSCVDEPHIEDEQEVDPIEYGVTAHAVKIGTHSDLTGPAALFGIQSVNGAQMRFDEVNAQGGIHGRRIEFIVEDSQYDVSRSLSAANKLLHQDKIFVMLIAAGTPNNNAVLTHQLPLGVPNLFPLSGSMDMSTPIHPLKFAQRGNYYIEMQQLTRFFVESYNIQRPCIIYVDNDFGHEVRDGVVAQLSELEHELVEMSSHKASETEFTSTLVRFKEADCDLLLLGTILRDTILLLEGIRKMAWHEVLRVGNSAAASRPIAEISSGAAEGYYAITHINPIYPNHSGHSSTAIAWFEKYFELHGEEPDVPAMEGYRAADLLCIALEQAGPSPTRQKFLKALESIDHYEDIFGHVLSFGADDHTGVDEAALIRVQNGRWVPQPILIPLTQNNSLQTQ